MSWDHRNNMAGIGFELRKIFSNEDSIFSTAKAMLVSTLVAVGPWLTTILTLNVFLVLANNFFQNLGQKDLFMGTIVYSFVFSQILIAPFQLLIVRYISDRLYSKQYGLIKASQTGLAKIIIVMSFGLSFAYYYGKAIPTYYKWLAIMLIMIISLTWVIIGYLSAVKNYKVITLGYGLGSLVSIVMVLWLVKHPLPFPEVSEATNFLLAFVCGTVVTYAILLISFFTAFRENNHLDFDFLKYVNKYQSLIWIGIFYTLGLWVDDILIWFSPLGINIYDTFRFAPLYDNAVFVGYLTIIPTMVLFTVSLETRFYGVYREYYGLIGKNGTLEQIKKAQKDMNRVLFNSLLMVMEIQLAITMTVIVLSKEIFALLNIPVLLSEIFRIVALGAFCNGFVLVIMLVMLYFDAKKHAALIAGIFCFGNVFFTWILLPLGENFFGVGYFIGALLSFIASLIILVRFSKNVIYYTFFTQPLFQKEEVTLMDKIVDQIHPNTPTAENEEAKQTSAPLILLAIILSGYLLFLTWVFFKT